MKKEQPQDDAPLRNAGYSPTRFEYFAGLIVQGLIIGRSEKDLRNVTKRAVVLAKEMERALFNS